jgi:hypothetical protein
VNKHERLSSCLSLGSIGDASNKSEPDAKAGQCRASRRFKVCAHEHVGILPGVVTPSCYDGANRLNL